MLLACLLGMLLGLALWLWVCCMAWCFGFGLSGFGSPLKDWFSAERVAWLAQVWLGLLAKAWLGICVFIGLWRECAEQLFELLAICDYLRLGICVFCNCLQLGIGVLIGLWRECAEHV